MAEDIIGDNEALMLVAKLRAYLGEHWISDGCRPIEKRELTCASCRMVEIDEHLQLLGHEIAESMQYEDYVSTTRKP